MINHDSYLGNIHGFRFKVINVLSKHFNQSFVIGQTCLRTKGKEWQTQRIHTEISLDAVRGFVGAETFGIYACITGIFGGL
jgi:hypothetical protein